MSYTLVSSNNTTNNNNTNSGSNYTIPRSQSTTSGPNTSSMRSILQRVPRLKINDSDIIEETEIEYTNSTITPDNSILSNNLNSNNSNSTLSSNSIRFNTTNTSGSIRSTNPFDNNYTYANIVNRSRSSSINNPNTTDQIQTHPIFKNNNPFKTIENNSNTNSTANNNTNPLIQQHQRRNSTNSIPPNVINLSTPYTTTQSIQNVSPSNSRRTSLSRAHLFPSTTNNTTTSTTSTNNVSMSRRPTVSSVSSAGSQSSSIMDPFGLNIIPRVTLLNSIDIRPTELSFDSNLDIIDHYLHNAGFLPSNIVYGGESENDDCTIRIASTAKDVLIPTISSNEDEYLARLNTSNNHTTAQEQFDMMDDGDEIVGDNDTLNTDMQSWENDLSSMSVSDMESDLISFNSSIITGRSRSGSRQRSSFSFSRQDMGTSRLPHGTNNHGLPHGITFNDNNLCYFKFAIIVSIKENTTLESIQLELASRANIKYLHGDEQFFKVGELDWNLNKYNFNLFLPHELKSLECDAIENFKNTIQWKLFKNTGVKKRISWSNNDNGSDTLWKDSLFQKFKNNNTDNSILCPGDYVFIVPVIFNNHIPESITYPSGDLDYFIRLATLKKYMKIINTDKNENQTQTTDIDIKPTLTTITTPTSTNNNTIPDVTYSVATPQVSNASIFKKVKSHFHSSGTINNSNSSSTANSSYFSPTGSADSSVSDFNRSYSRNSSSTRESVDITDLNFTKMSMPQTNVSYVVNELYLQNKVNVIRTPPLISVSTANKPVYINKVWDNSLAYEISLPHKYIPIDSTVPITIKLSPLIKHISLVKLAVGISERIGYSNPKDKKLSFKETDHILKDPSNPFYHVFNSKKKKERLLLLYELRSQQVGPRALKEEIVSNCINNNLLSYYKTNGNNTPNGVDNFIEPIEIKTKLQFPGEKNDLLSNHKFNSNNQLKKKTKIENPYGVDGYILTGKYDNLDSFYPSTPNGSIPNVEPIRERSHHKNSFVNFFFGGNNNNTNNHDNKNTTSNNKRVLSSSSMKSGNKPQPQPKSNIEKTQINIFSKKNIAMISTNLYKAKRGLYIDSTHFSTLKCKHKLEIIMRFEKYDENKLLRQYEVVVNTPVYLMSDKCTTDNLELPAYDIDGDTYYQPRQDKIDASLPPPPTFEESLSNPLFLNSNISVNSNSNNNNYTYSNITQKIPFHLNTEFSNLDGLLNNEVISSTYRRISNGATNLATTMERIPSPPPAYLDVVPSQS